MIIIKENTLSPEFRRNHIGASDSPIIMGVSPWTTPYQLWELKLGLREPQVTNKAMKRGNDYEELARIAFQRDTGHVVVPMAAGHDQHSFMHASFDGMSFDFKVAVELKVPGKEDHELALRGVIPEKYQWQLAKQLLVSGLYMVYYYSYDWQTDKGICLKYFRDEKILAQLENAEIEFWEMVQTLKAPKLIEKDYEQKRGQEWQRPTDRYKYLTEQRKLIDDEMELVREEIIALTDDRNCIGNGIKVSKLISKGRVDYDAIPELKTINLDDYRKEPIQTWRITAC